MKKRIKKHIDKKELVKLFLVDRDGDQLINFNGVIFAQNDEFVLMNDMFDFHFDGFVIVKKSDITEIKRTENEAFIDKIIESEGLKDQIEDKYTELGLSLSNFPEMFDYLKMKGKPVIIQDLYNGKDIFQIGPINSIEKKKVFIDYFNARGEYDLKPVSSKFKDITYVRIDSPYAEMFFKYSRRIE